MEKQSRLVGSRILKLLSKAAQPAVTYHSPPPSPRKTPGPMISLIPSEARRKPRNGITFGKEKDIEGFLPKEAPTKKEGDENDNNNPDGLVAGSSRGPERVPSLGQMRRFASGRGGVLADFDLILEVHDDQLGDVKIGWVGIVKKEIDVKYGPEERSYFEEKKNRFSSSKSSSIVKTHVQKN
ncbi:hypothetical protein GBA52_023194 [Prunus armeniaca]|nr:hypothetical protein GBA52_023194 [Prunus armeniaca]